MNASTRAAPIVPLSLPVLPIATAAPSHADAELLRLYGELKTAWATERAIISAGGDDDEVNAAIDISSTIVDKICKCHAVTMEGIRVKASAVLWCHGGNLPIRFVDDDEWGTDLQVAQSIVNDLIAMAT
jgi:hypothetical protein